MNVGLCHVVLSCNQMSVAAPCINFFDISFKLLPNVRGVFRICHHNRIKVNLIYTRSVFVHVYKYRIASMFQFAFSVIFLSLFLLTPQVAVAQNSGLFGSREIQSSNMKSFGKWTELWRRHMLQRAEDAQGETTNDTEGTQNCRGRNRIRCSRDAWEKFVAEQQAAIGTDGSGENASPGSVSVTPELLFAVNLYMNKSTYIVDPVNWGIPDHWATPDEFFLKDGDCEDYAISKYVTLKRLGVDPDSMRLVILQDENLRVAHAVLAVEFEGNYHILDNQVDSVLTHDKILHYRPVYSINETAWWLHQVRRFGR